MILFYFFFFHSIPDLPILDPWSSIPDFQETGIRRLTIISILHGNNICWVVSNKLCTSQLLEEEQCILRTKNGCIGYYMVTGATTKKPLSKALICITLPSSNSKSLDCFGSIFIRNLLMLSFDLTNWVTRYWDKQNWTLTIYYLLPVHVSAVALLRYFVSY